MRETYLEVTFRHGRAIGIELTAPGQVSLPVLNQVLADLGRSPMTQDDLAPLCEPRCGSVDNRLEAVRELASLSLPVDEPEVMARESVPDLYRARLWR